jgi:hypothetical protein
MWGPTKRHHKHRPRKPHPQPGAARVDADKDEDVLPFFLRNSVSSPIQR